MAERGGPSLTRGLLGRPGSASTRGASARLPSINSPRDLTLGGIKKKTFVPNIPIRQADRGKKQAMVDDSVEAKPKPHGSRGRGHRDRGGRGGRGRGRGRGRGADIIESNIAVFEAAPASDALRRASRPDDYYGERTATSTMRKVKVKSEETPKAVIDELLRDTFIHDDFKDSLDITTRPVSLPVSDLIKEELETRVKKSKPVMSSDEDSDDVDSVGGETSRSSSKKKTSHDAESSVVLPNDVPLAELFTNPEYSTDENHSNYMLLQLPDVLPGDPTDLDRPYVPRHKRLEQEKQAAAAGSSSDQADSKPSGNSLSDYKEGLIGKIQIRQSGRVQLCLGDVTLDLTKGTNPSFLQDLVSIECTNNTQEMHVLGHVTQKVIALPDVRTLLQQYINTNNT